MNRIVLAILALFAGLAAQVAPAEARLCGKVEIGATLGFKPAARIVAVQAAEPFRPEPRREVRAEVPVPDALPLVSAFAPAVRLGPDRARE
ncbi:hypothetical protein [Novosphingobium sp.]|uniref:hypothetical protein n=1 Tax=Novosphingobium sp. TaxID=1874826 RepID=UPI0025FE153F|nr:hypothetical protein [Novosphingobium sp.]MCC6925753.1 hypothetical protein [Novosphingobium sp.]